MSAQLDARHRVQEYLRKIAEAKRDEAASEDTDDRVGARHRTDLEITWLGLYVYENAHVLGLSAAVPESSEQAADLREWRENRAG